MGAFWGGKIWHIPIGRLEGIIHKVGLAFSYWLVVGVLTYVSMFLHYMLSSFDFSSIHQFLLIIDKVEVYVRARADVQVKRLTFH